MGTLDAVQAGMVGARKITSIAVDSTGVPHIAFTDRRKVVYASRAGGAWSETLIYENREGRLGQLVEFALDGQDRPHVTFFEVTATSPALMGDIKYGTTSVTN